ncbi:MAG: hypothetical protein VW378_01100 [bacterium]
MDLNHALERKSHLQKGALKSGVGVTPDGHEAPSLVASGTAEALTKGESPKPVDASKKTDESSEIPRPTEPLRTEAVTAAHPTQELAAVEVNLEDPEKVKSLVTTALDRHYKVPFRGKEAAQTGKLNRRLHGATHVSRVACNALFFAEFAQQEMGEKALSPKEKSLLELIAIYHDSGNVNDGTGVDTKIKRYVKDTNPEDSHDFSHEAGHVQRFLDDMLEAGVADDDDLRAAAFAIEMKDIPTAESLDKQMGAGKGLNVKLACTRTINGDGSYSYQTLQEYIQGKSGVKCETTQGCIDWLTAHQTPMQRYLHDADCLDIIRARSHFDPAYLSLYSQTPPESTQRALLDQVIERHKVFIDRTDRKGTLHQACEHSEDPYGFMKEQLEVRYVQESVKVAHQNDHELPDKERLLEGLSMADLYICNPEKIASKLVPRTEGTRPKVTAAELNGQTFAYRAIKSFDEELAVLGSNYGVLQELEYPILDSESKQALCEYLNFSDAEARHIVEFLKSSEVQNVLTENKVSFFEELTPEHQQSVLEGLQSRLSEDSEQQIDLKTCSDILKTVKMQQLRNYVRDNKKTPENKEGTPLKWRPCTLTTPEVKPLIFNAQVALVFDPVMKGFSYKKNVGSNRAGKNSFDYTPQQGGNKNQGALQAGKMAESHARMHGEVADRGLGRVDQQRLRHNETLSAYTIEDVRAAVLMNCRLDGSEQLNTEQKAMLRKNYEEVCYRSAHLGRVLPMFAFVPGEGYQGVNIQHIDEALKRNKTSDLKSTSETMKPHGITYSGLSYKELTQSADLERIKYMDWHDMHWLLSEDTVSLAPTEGIEISDVAEIVKMRMDISEIDFDETKVDASELESGTYVRFSRKELMQDYGEVSEIVIKQTQEGMFEVKIKSAFAFELNGQIDLDEEVATKRDNLEESLQGLLVDLKSLNSQDSQALMLKKNAFKLSKQLSDPSQRQEIRKASEAEHSPDGTDLQYCCDLAEPEGHYVVVYKDASTHEEKFLLKNKEGVEPHPDYSGLIDKAFNSKSEGSLYASMVKQLCVSYVDRVNSLMGDHQEWPFKFIAIQTNGSKTYLQIIPKEGQSKDACLGYMNSLSHPEGSPAKDKAHKFPQLPQDHVFVEVYMPALEALIE